MWTAIGIVENLLKDPLFKSTLYTNDALYYPFAANAIKGKILSLHPSNHTDQLVNGQEKICRNILKESIFYILDTLWGNDTAWKTTIGHLKSTVNRDQNFNATPTLIRVFALDKNNINHPLRELRKEPLEKLPPELMGEFSQYISPKDVSSLAQTNKGVNTSMVDNIEQMWHTMFQRDFPADKDLELPEGASWKQLYKSHQYIKNYIKNASEHFIKHVTWHSSPGTVICSPPSDVWDDDRFKNSAETLILDTYNITSLSEGIGNLSKLRHLSVSVSPMEIEGKFIRGSKLRRLPESIRNLTNLCVLSINYCPIEVFPDGFFELLKNVTYTPYGASIWDYGLTINMDPRQKALLDGDPRFNDPVIQQRILAREIKFVVY
jgi:hypothetical protein